MHTTILAAIIAISAATGPAPAATRESPAHLRTLLSDIANRDADAFPDVVFRVIERSGTGVYTATDFDVIVPALIARAERTPAVRADVVMAIGQVGHIASVPYVMASARRGDPAVRDAAMQALGALGDERALSLVDSVKTALGRSSGADPRAIEIADYAGKIIRRKREIARANPDARARIVRSTLLDEPNWQVRADVARYLESEPGAGIWPLLFDAYSRWPGSEAWAMRLSGVVTARYRFDSAGFVAELRKRNTNERVFGITAIEGIVARSDVGPLTEMAEAESEESVRELTIRALSGVMDR